MLDPDLFKALASDKRLQILDWLRDPEAHFPPQQDGDLVEDGVCSCFIADKLAVSQPTCGEHLKILSRVGLLRSKKIKQWVFYQRDEDRIEQVKHALSTDWCHRPAAAWSDQLDNDLAQHAALDGLVCGCDVLQ